MKETIVVEGKDDETLLKSIYEVDIIRTNGTHLSKETLEEIRAAHEDHGVIVFTDPDHPGEEIRRKINEAVPGVKNAFLTSKSRKKNLVGVEHATKQEIEDALSHLLTYEDEEETLSRKEFNRLGLSGEQGSQGLRIYLEDYYHLGHGSAKTLYKRLNSRKLSYEEIKKVLDQINE